MVTAIAAILVFLFVVLFHEFGHFIVAKMVGVKVDEFSIGMGPKLLQKSKGETSYTLRLLPIGGYVSLEGEDEDSSDPRSLANASPWSRIAIMAAGALMNFVLAILVFSIVSFNNGVPTTTIKSTIDGSPASKAGLVADETIVEIDGKKIVSWEDISKNITGDKEISVTTKMGGSEKTYKLTPEKAEDGRMTIGIYPKMEKSFIKSIKQGFLQTGLVIKSMFTVFGMLITGGIKGGQLSGPIGVISTIGKAANESLMMVLTLTGFISVNLGFFNLLPIPALDGSRILFTFIELFRGKPIDPEKEGRIHFIGFVLLLLLMLFVSYSDIVNLFKG